MKGKFGQHGKKILAVLLTASMSIGLSSFGTISDASVTNGLKTADEQAVGENEVYGYGTMTMSYAEFYAGDVDNSEISAVSSATVQKSSTFPNADSTEPTDDGYKINGVKNVPVKVMASASDELKARVTLNADGTAEPTQYKLVDKNGIGATVYDIKDTVKDATATLKTNSVWGDYEIDIVEKSTSYLRNTRSDIKDAETGEVFEIGSQIQGVILQTDKGYKVAATHMENIWVQPYEVAFSLEGNANSSEFKKLVGEKISKVTFIMPTATYVYDLGEGVYIKPAYQNEVSGCFNSEGTTFTLDQEITGLTNATIAINYKEGRKTTTLLDSTALSGREYTLTTAVPNDKFVNVIISCDEYADITVGYPIMSWQKEKLEGMVSDAATILIKIDDAVLNSHKTEAEELLANESATAGQADELISELTSLLDSATVNLKNATITKLSETIDEAKKLVETDFTPSSWAVLCTALAAADTQLATPGTQAEVEEAVEGLTQAINALEKKTATPTKTPTETTTPTETPTGPATPTPAPAGPAASTPVGTTTPTVTTSSPQTEDASTAIGKKKVTIKNVTSKNKKQITVKWKNLSKADGYQIQYALNKKFQKAKVKNVKKVSKAVIKKLKSGKKYYVRIRAYTKTNGKKAYSKYSTVKSIKVKK